MNMVKFSPRAGTDTNGHHLSGYQSSNSYMQCNLCAEVLTYRSLQYANQTIAPCRSNHLWNGIHNLHRMWIKLRIQHLLNLPRYLMAKPGFLLRGTKYEETNTQRSWWWFSIYYIHINIVIPPSKPNPLTGSAPEGTIYKIIKPSFTHQDLWLLNS